MLRIGFCWIFFLCMLALRNNYVNAKPTGYKMNEHKIYEAELVAVSSTVIPFPIYEVHSNLKLPAHKIQKDEKKPVGSLALITSSNKHAHLGNSKSEFVATDKQMF